MDELCLEVASLREEDQMNVMLPNETLGNNDNNPSSRDSSPLMESFLPNTDASLHHIQGVDWADEMEILQPHKDGDIYRNMKTKKPTHIVKMSPITEEVLK